MTPATVQDMEKGVQLYWRTDIPSGPPHGRAGNTATVIRWQEGVCQSGTLVRIFGAGWWCLGWFEVRP